MHPEVKGLLCLLVYGFVCCWQTLYERVEKMCAHQRSPADYISQTEWMHIVFRLHKDKWIEAPFIFTMKSYAYMDRVCGFSASSYRYRSLGVTLELLDAFITRPQKMPTGHIFRCIEWAANGKWVSTNEHRTSFHTHTLFTTHNLPIVYIQHIASLFVSNKCVYMSFGMVKCG